jgi:hypothetical protein
MTALYPAPRRRKNRKLRVALALLEQRDGETVLA